MSNRHRLTQSVAGALAIAALAAPAAGAFPAEQVQGNPNPNAPSRSSLVTRAPAPTVTRTIDQGFDTGSAAIGAGGAAAVLLLTAAGLSAGVHRHRRVGMQS